MTPCKTCAMLITHCGIKSVVCEKKYHLAKESEEIFKQAGTKIKYKANETQKY